MGDFPFVKPQVLTDPGLLSSLDVYLSAPSSLFIDAAYAYGIANSGVARSSSTHPLNPVMVPQKLSTTYGQIQMVQQTSSDQRTLLTSGGV